MPSPTTEQIEKYKDTASTELKNKFDLLETLSEKQLVEMNKLIISLGASPDPKVYIQYWSATIEAALMYRFDVMPWDSLGKEIDTLYGLASSPEVSLEDPVGGTYL